MRRYPCCEYVAFTVLVVIRSHRGQSAQVEVTMYHVTTGVKPAIVLTQEIPQPARPSAGHSLQIFSILFEQEVT
ncbi:hypothetical protein E2C01_031204 [Portunus trituberculatus]|uniref:Uncharacterized protein n=1 Tax=Portunus trituberculatus TaxID=210409 RepID=A0A5B7EZF8_PORTR|nr:hypothetical protein [Portunus trituberculatus]